MITLIEQIRQELIQSTDEGTRASEHRYFKEAIKLYGVKYTVVGAIGKKYLDIIKEKPKGEIFDLCDELWQSGFMEESFIACNWSYLIHQQYEEQDLQVFKRWLESYVSNWAACDALCNHTVGTYLEMYPDQISELKGWAVSKNRWMRRGSAVSLIIPARNGKFLPDIFEIALILLTDPDDLVQKGYGWMLKAASEAHQEPVFDFVVQHKATMPRTALRYAIEKMPAELKKQAMSR